MADVPSVDQLPYCGPPPRPDTFAAAWNLDPWLLAALALLAAGYAWGSRRSGAAARVGRTRLAFAAALAGLVAAFVSPLCSLGVALFSARIGQHLLLVSVAAPLLVLGSGAMVAGCRLAAVTHRLAARPLAAGLAFAAAFWCWHVPAAYAASLRSDGVYWTMHASLLMTGCWVWAAILRRETPAGAPLALLTSLQVGLLGALLAFAPRPLYASHLATTAPWGLSPLEDQALGGVLCWTLGCVPFALGGFAALAPWLRAALAAGERETATDP